jgi:hypothetical protein
LLGLLYRERFGLTQQELEDEPAEAFGYWLAVEARRRQHEERQRRR